MRQTASQFNISVGYDLAGIQSEKIDTFLNTMKNAADSEVFRSCRQYLLDNVDKFEKVTKEDIEAIEPEICNSVTISTLHGCPPQEIEKIAMYLITVKGFHTFIKCIRRCWDMNLQEREWTRWATIM